MGQLSFRARLTWILLIVVVLEGTFIGIFSYSHSERIVVENKKREMADTVNRIDININTKVRYMMDIIDDSATGTLVSAALSSWRDGNGDSAAMAYLEEYYLSLPRSLAAVYNIIILDENGVVYSYEEMDGKKTDQSLALSYEQLAKTHQDKTVWAGLSYPLLYDSQEERVLMIPVVRAIMDGDQLIGTMVVELETDSLSNLLLGNQGIFQHQYTFIVDRGGEIICTDKKIDNSWLGEIDSRFERGIRKFELEWNGNNYYVCGQYNGVTGWKTYSVIAKSDIFPQSELLRKSIMFLVMACMLGVGVVTALISYYLTKPIDRLSAAMKQVQKGDFEIRVPNKRRDEIGKLTDSFNFMIGKMSSLVKQVYQEKIAQTNAELGALQAQINPHFLYNTLDSINWMLIDKGEDEISDIIISLGGLMRYCIDQEDPFVPMDQEFQYILAYFKIQKNRLEERLSYEIFLPDRLKQMEVPRLILQPLVENAITHGIELCQKDGVVRIEAWEDEEHLFIAVEDNGPGMAAEQICMLEQQADQEKEGYTGIGLRNVDRRIRLHYGEQYHLKIESIQGKGTRVTVKIPKNIWGGDL